MRKVLLAALLGLTASVAFAQQPAADWAAALRADAEALHADVAANHPGPVNDRDPDFSQSNDAALALALERARQVTDYPGYLAALRGYTAAFDDGHLAFASLVEAPVALRWPGFLTAFAEDGRQVVRARADDAPVPMGAELVGCDGRDAARLAEENVGAFRGRWSLAAMRGREGYRLFVDNGNPFVTLPQRCRFRVEGQEQVVDLQWRAMPDAEWQRHAVPLAAPPRQPIAARQLADGTRWYAISSFDGDLASDTAKALLPMIATMESGRAELVAAPRIVLDLRGNGGGSSDWSLQIATILWGQAAVDALPDDASYVEWRVSPANVASLAEYRDTFAAAPDASTAVKDYFKAVAAGMAEALAAGKPLWREPPDLYVTPPVPPGAVVSPLRGPVYVLTDGACGSACLDAVDLWTALGAIQVGQETSADTFYMDLRDDVLPGGRIRAYVPMKVYRDRARGSNQPHVPAHRFTGDMRDTAALEGWIAALPR
jgi:hypothetical protein